MFLGANPETIDDILHLPKLQKARKKKPSSTEAAQVKKIYIQIRLTLAYESSRALLKRVGFGL